MTYGKNNFCPYDVKGNSFQIIMCMWGGEAREERPYEHIHGTWSRARSGPQSYETSLPALPSVFLASVSPLSK